MNAQINPTGIVVDGNGNIYLADNGRIRKITGDGAIHTFAGIGPAGYSGDGGLAISAGMDPEKLALDSHGNLFFSDPAAVRVRKITEPLASFPPSRVPVWRAIRETGGRGPRPS